MHPEILNKQSDEFPVDDVQLRHGQFAPGINQFVQKAKVKLPKLVLSYLRGDVMDSLFMGFIQVCHS